MKSQSKKYYLTTAIPFVNSRPHIGFALEVIQADVLARSHRQKGDDVFFLTGTDENSLKNVQAAEKEGISTRELCDRNSAYFFNLKKSLNLSFDEFIRTTETRHFKGAQKLWQACKKEDIYKKKYKGFYCVGCEAFYLEKDLPGGKCPEHKTAPEVVEEENYFFRLSNYQKQLEKLIESDQYKITPQTRKNEILSFIRMGLEDFSISRSVQRAKGWGVPVPGDESQIMYVWFDALSNYLNALDYAEEGQNFKKYWPADVHVVGKGIIRFHAVYWPAMLLSAGIELPRELFVHGYVNVGGEKMSKTLGNVVDPEELVARYGTDAVRYYFLKAVSPFEDGDFTEEKFLEIYNADLANGLGNLVSRVSNLIEKNFNGKIKLNKIKETADLADYLAKYQFNECLKSLGASISLLDKEVDKNKLWEMVKDDKDKAGEILSQLASELVYLSDLLLPFMPETAEKIKVIFSSEKIVKPVEPLFLRKS